MQELKEYPAYWVYYCTMGSEVLGKITLTPTELVFEPLNDNFKGFISYEGTSLLNIRR